MRSICEELRVSETEVYSRWIPYEGIQVESRIIPTKDGHIRKHVIISDRECEAYDCGFAVEIDVEGEKQVQDGKMAKVENHYSVCAVETTCGEGEGIIISADPNTNLLHPMTRIPAVRYPVHVGKMELTTIVNCERNH